MDVLKQILGVDPESFYLFLVLMRNMFFALDVLLKKLERFYLLDLSLEKMSLIVHTKL